MDQKNYIHKKLKKRKMTAFAQLPKNVLKIHLPYKKVSYDCCLLATNWLTYRFCGSVLVSTFVACCFPPLLPVTSLLSLINA